MLQQITRLVQKVELNAERNFVSQKHNEMIQLNQTQESQFCRGKTRRSSSDDHGGGLMR